MSASSKGTKVLNDGGLWWKPSRWVLREPCAPKGMGRVVLEGAVLSKTREHWAMIGSLVHATIGTTHRQRVVCLRPVPIAFASGCHISFAVSQRVTNEKLSVQAVGELGCWKRLCFCARMSITRIYLVNLFSVSNSQRQQSPPTLFTYNLFSMLVIQKVAELSSFSSLPL